MRHAYQYEENIKRIDDGLSPYAGWIGTVGTKLADNWLDAKKAYANDKQTGHHAYQLNGLELDARQAQAAWGVGFHRERWMGL